MRTNLYWPITAEDLIQHVPTCRSCVKFQGVKGTMQNLTKFFQPSGPLKNIAIDLLGPLSKTRNGNKYIVVISDRYSKLTRAVIMRKTTEPFLAAVALNLSLIHI